MQRCLRTQTYPTNTPPDRDAVCIGMTTEDDVYGGRFLHACRTQADGVDTTLLVELDKLAR
jgi:hypothetical protein